VRIAILAAVHGNDAGKVIRQANNYIHMLRDSELHFLFHVSMQSSARFRDQLYLYTSRPHLQRVSFYISDVSRMTSTSSVLNALITLTSFMSRLWINPDFVVWHTDSDLIVRRGIEKTFSSYDFGVGINSLNIISGDWQHLPKMRADTRSSEAFLKYGISDSEMFFGRTECSFYNIWVWTYISSFLLQSFGDSYFDNVDNHWCAEEVILPTLCQFLRKSHGLRGRDQLCWTKKIGEEYATRDNVDAFVKPLDIRHIRRVGWYYAAKWFRY